MKRALKALSWGLVVGAAAGLLLAPEAGNETRDRLSEKSRLTMRKVRNAIQSSSHTAEQRMERIGRRLQELRDEFPDRSEVIDTVQTAEGKLQRLQRDVVRAVTE